MKAITNITQTMFTDTIHVYYCCEELGLILFSVVNESKAEKTAFDWLNNSHHTEHCAYTINDIQRDKYGDYVAHFSPLFKY